MPAVEDPPRPPAPPERPALWTRLDSLRSDPRVGVVLLVVILLSAGVAWLRSSGGSPPADPAGTPVMPSSVPTTARSALVHVVGAVHEPGVVELPGGARALDAIAAAGGATVDADLARINLAAPVSDGLRLAVPRVGDPALPPVDGSLDGAAPGAPVNLNTATATELETLPGIGPTLAAAIVRERERRGGFARVEDLQQVRGIGERRFAELRDLVTV